LSTDREAIDPTLQKLLTEFEDRSGLTGIDYDVIARPTGKALVLEMAHPTDRYFRVLQEAQDKLGDDTAPTSTIRKRSASNRLQSPEAKYFLRTLSESLNINRFSFKEDFFARYTKSVSNAESLITAAANHIVLGRRGSGKSSLLLFALRVRDREKRRSAWVDMQAYERRKDARLAVDIITEIIRQFGSMIDQSPLYGAVQVMLRRLRSDEEFKNETLRESIPQIRELFRSVEEQVGNLFIFLDDFHVIDPLMQPQVLGTLYSITRGNNFYLKISAIETLTRLWDLEERTGLQVPHDAQTIKLDYNLTMPDKAAAHIEGILDAHAVYCGLPSVRYLCTNNEVLSRLVWVSAGVPRDALNMFAQAMTKGAARGQSRVSVTNINIATSELVTQKLRDIETDVPGSETDQTLNRSLEAIREFCIKEKRKNAFLVEIKHTDIYRDVLKLVDLRLLHVISEGITIGDAGRKYLALILDYGFYVGIRAAQSVDLFNEQTQRVPYKELRKLPVLEMEED
jgi:hypothetical protein